MSTSKLEAELQSLESKKEEHLRKFEAAINSNPNQGNAKQLILSTIQLCCKIQRVRISLRNQYENDIEIINSKIVVHQSEKKQCKDRRKVTNGRKKKKHREPIPFFNRNSSKTMSDVSFYFRSHNDKCRLENEDMIDIQASSYVFLSSLHVSKAWTKNDRVYLLVAVGQHSRQHGQHANLRQLEALYNELKVTRDEQKISSIDQQTNFMMNNLGTDTLQAINAEDIDWDSISKEYFHGRYSPEEVKAVWSLAANPDIRMKKWTLAEQILLRCLARDNNYQDWERVNKLMPTPRNGFLCFSRYCYVFKRKHVTVGQQNQKDISAIREVSSLNESAHDLSANLICDNVRHFDNATTTKKKRMFSKREKFLIYNYLRRGYSFRMIASMLHNRTEKQVRDHYRMSIQRKNFKSWNKREDNRLLAAIKYVGRGRWRMISGLMDNRTPDQCRVRFNFLLKHQKKDVDTYLKRKFQKTRTLHHKIKKFLTSKTRKFSCDKKVEKYFIQQLDRTVQRNRKLDSLPDDVLNTLKFLNYDLSCIPKNEDFIDWLANYPPTNIESRPEFEQFFSKEFTKLQRKQKTWPMKPAPNKNNIFSHVFYKSKVLPPNKSGIYGLNKLIKNFEMYSSEHKDVNFATLWKQQNDAYSKQKYFTQSKMLWYKALRATLFWPLKLETYRPEDLS